MKKHGLFYILWGLTLVPGLYISSTNFFGQDLSLQQRNFSTSDSIVWKTRPIAKVGEPAPGGGMYEEMGDTYFLESGVLLFWGQYGKRQEKDWALYSYRNGKTKLEFKAFEEFIEPDGITKQFKYHSHQLRNGYPGLNKASQYFLYLYSGYGGLGLNSHIYGLNGEGLKKIIGTGDKLILSGNREVIISGVRLDRITNDNQAVIFFISEKPKVKGWVLHSKEGLKNLFAIGDEVPGLRGINISGFYSPPIEPFIKDNNLFIFGDTMLAKLYVQHANFREGLFRITPLGTEILDSSNLLGIDIINAAGGNNFIVRSDHLYQYIDGKRITILDRNQTFSEDKTGKPVILKGKPIYTINNSVYLGLKNEGILLGIKRNDYNFDQVLYYFTNGNLTGVKTIKPQPNNIVVPYLIGVRHAPTSKGAFVDNVFKDNDGNYFATAPLIMTKNLELVKGGIYFDEIGTSLTQPKALITEGEDYFDYSNIIVQPDANRLIVWRRPFVTNLDLFELFR